MYISLNTPKSSEGSEHAANPFTAFGHRCWSYDVPVCYCAVKSIKGKDKRQKKVQGKKHNILKG